MQTKFIRYRIYGVTDIPADDTSSLTETLDKIREYGDGTIVAIELLDKETKLPDLDEDFVLQRKKSAKKATKAEEK